MRYYAYALSIGAKISDLECPSTTMQTLLHE